MAYLGNKNNILLVCCDCSVSMSGEHLEIGQKMLKFFFEQFSNRRTQNIQLIVNFFNDKKLPFYSGWSWDSQKFLEINEKWAEYIGGCTRLWESIFEEVENQTGQNSNPITVVIYSDGQDNASTGNFCGIEGAKELAKRLQSQNIDVQFNIVAVNELDNETKEVFDCVCGSTGGEFISVEDKVKQALVEDKPPPVKYRNFCLEIQQSSSSQEERKAIMVQKKDKFYRNSYTRVNLGVLQTIFQEKNELIEKQIQERKEQINIEDEEIKNIEKELKGIAPELSAISIECGKIEKSIKGNETKIEGLEEMIKMFSEQSDDDEEEKEENKNFARKKIEKKNKNKRKRRRGTEVTYGTIGVETSKGKGTG